MWYDKRTCDKKTRENDDVPSLLEEVYRAGVGLVIGGILSVFFFFLVLAITHDVVVP